MTVSGTKCRKVRLCRNVMLSATLPPIQDLPRWERPGPPRLPTNHWPSLQREKVSWLPVAGAGAKPGQARQRSRSTTTPCQRAKAGWRRRKRLTSPSQPSQQGPSHLRSLRRHSRSSQSWEFPAARPTARQHQQLVKRSLRLKTPQGLRPRMLRKLVKTKARSPRERRKRRSRPKRRKQPRRRCRRSRRPQPLPSRTFSRRRDFPACLMARTRSRRYDPRTSRRRRRRRPRRRHLAKHQQRRCLRRKRRHLAKLQQGRHKPGRKRRQFPRDSSRLRQLCFRLRPPTWPSGSRPRHQFRS
mmetsp:Transcript_56716/g.132571  ORF Transcript_56716/g.132571 Transcript_56716/m.132571 type:complete len:299 (+) Transcript_56716:699-1595(+)